VTALIVLDLTLRSPTGMAVVAVIASWVALSVPLGDLYPDEIRPFSLEPVVLLAALALPVGLIAFRLRGYRPWRTALLALGVAGLVAAALAQVFPPASVAPPWGAALGVLAYRWD